MAKTSYIEIPSGYESIYKAVLQSGDRFTLPNVRVKTPFLSRKKIKGITEKSLLVSLGPVWQALDQGVKNAWNAAGVASKMSGFKLFVQDTSYRKRLAIPGYADPNINYQSLVGHIEIVGPATGLQIEQPHPLTYYVMHKVTGTRSQYIPVAVTESFGFPLEIGISWKTALTSLGSGSGARFFAVVYSSYQGKTLETILQIPFGLTDDWQKTTATLSTVFGLVQGYSVFIEVVNCTGDLYFDDVIIEHSGQNWARDPNCNAIASSFTGAYQQVARHWAATNATDGAGFRSEYHIPN